MKEAFRKKGGTPKRDCPIYFKLGWPRWAEEVVDPATVSTTERIEIPLSIFDKHDISFTYPDIMISALLAQQPIPEYYE